MASADLVVGIDCSTTATKAVVWEREGNAVADGVRLPAGLPIVSGVGDGQAAGLGGRSRSRAYPNLGTAVVSGIYSEEYSWGDEYRVMSGPIPRTYILETLLAAGIYTVSWFAENFGGIDAEELGVDLSAEQILEAAAARLEPGSEALLAVPYWNNALTPYWDFAARGVMFGWTGAHGKAHAYRAILEGIAFEQRLMTGGAKKGLEKPVERPLAMGGGSNSSFWCQILTDVMQRPVTVCQDVESTCLGAGMLAAAAAGVHDDVREASGVMFGEDKAYKLDDDNAARYDRIYGIYKELYPNLSSLFPALDEALKA